MASLPPSFPKGLRVLLVDDEQSLPVVTAQLQQHALQYSVTACMSSTEALAYSRAASKAFDVVLAESKLVAADEVTGRAFVDAFDQVPVVLMSEGGVTDDVMRAVRLGAVDFLDKPLSVLKLKNIWQHSVRKLMQRTSLYDSTCPAAAAAAPHSFMGHTFSEPAGGLTSQPSLSGCLPSSMTAPIGVAPPLHRVTSVGDANVIDSNPKTGCTHRCSIDSPGTPSAGDAELAETVSAGSVHQLMDGTCHGMGGNTADASGVATASCQDWAGCDWEKEAKEARSSLNAEKLLVKESGGHSVAHSASQFGLTATNPFIAASHRKPAASLPRQKASIEQSWSFGQTGKVGSALLYSSSTCTAAAPNRWPALPPGCVWGTPVGGPLLPPPFTSTPPPSSCSQGISVPPPASSTTSTPTSPPLCMLQGTLRTHSGGNNTAAPVLIKSRPAAPMELPAWRPSTPADFQPTNELPLLPEGFFSLDKLKEDIKKGPSGPIGLKLRKSNSLVDLINEALASPARG